MQKLPTIFERNPDNRREILDNPHPDCEWVFAGEGVATRKYDGTCCLIKDGVLFKRREIKSGKPQSQDFVLADKDEVTGKTVGWVSVTDSKENRWHMEAFASVKREDGTYELLGPKIQGNPERVIEHILLRHSLADQYADVPRSFDELREWLTDKDIEGLVFHHLDGRMAKIKKRDFGLKRT